MLEARNVNKTYSTGSTSLEVLKNVSLRVDRGDAVSIMGPSGSGKSTLLYILGALEAPSNGTVTLDGENPYALDEPRQAAFRNRKVGFLFQDHCLLPQLSVMENVLTPLLVDGAPTSDDLARAKLLLSQVGLAARSDHKPGELSGGEKQRAALARALIRQPAVLLCDEPTGNLDHKSSVMVADLLAAQSTTRVVVTHSVELADRFATRLEMFDGNLRARS